MTLSDGQRRILQLLSGVLGIPVAFILLFVAYGAYVDWRYVTPWEHVARGDTEDRVIALLGRPHRVIVQHSDKGSWQSDHHVEWFDADIAKDFKYVPFSITGEEYEVSFDPSGRVVSKFHITSP